MIDKNPEISASLELQELDLKSKTEQELFEAVLQAGESWSYEEKAMVTGAYNLARTLHEQDTHRGMPYTYHLLRNANRVTGYLHITDPEIVAAVLLHDSVEDHLEEIIQTATLPGVDLPEIEIPDDPVVKQQVALERIAALFSLRVADMVGVVTNPPELDSQTLSYEQKMQKYVEKVQSAIETPEGWIVKVVDWIDNGLGIIHNDEPADSPRLQHFARKYGMVAPAFEERYRRPDIQSMLDPEAKIYIENQLLLAAERLMVA